MKPRAMSVALAAGAALAGAIPATAADGKVSVQDNFFAKKTISVSKGDKVSWDWSRAGTDHNVTFTKVPSGAKKKHSKDQSSGTFSYKFSKAGTYKYVCTIHADSDDMKGTVKVK